jgi:hypothetical protein
MIVYLQQSFLFVFLNFITPKKATKPIKSMPTTIAISSPVYSHSVVIFFSETILYEFLIF